jgi:UDP-N-acetyl-D-mannosaminuronic acid dehydrogenase
MPLATMLAQAGHLVRGMDVNASIVQALQRGESPILEPGLSELVAEVVRNGRLRASHTLEEADVFFVCVSVPLRGTKPDFTAFRAALATVASKLRRGNLVVIESTLPPGSTTRVAQPLLERSGLVAGRDFHLVYCPERVLPGQLVKELVDNDRLLGGIDAASAQRAHDIYRTFVRGRLVLTDALTAELAKLMENTYRTVNIALANEFALVAEAVGGNVWDAIRVANSHPRVHVHQPGPGLGGHCLPKDPWLLLSSAPQTAGVIRSALRTSARMQNHIVRLLTKALDGTGRRLRGSRICIMGAAYKGGVSDTRESPGLALARTLERKGAKVALHDPYVTAPSVTKDLHEAIRGCAALVLAADHPEYRNLDWAGLARRMASRPLLVDTRGWLAQAPAGFTLVALGRSRPPEGNRGQRRGRPIAAASPTNART